MATLSTFNTYILQRDKTLGEYHTTSKENYLLQNNLLPDLPAANNDIINPHHNNRASNKRNNHNLVAHGDITHHTSNKNSLHIIDEPKY